MHMNIFPSYIYNNKEFFKEFIPLKNLILKEKF